MRTEARPKDGDSGRRKGRHSRGERDEVGIWKSRVGTGLVKIPISPGLVPPLHIC